MTHNKTTVTTHNVHITLTQSDIIALLRASGEKVPKGTTVSFTVPMGGDWSGEALELTNGYSLDVNYTTVEEK